MYKSILEIFFFLVIQKCVISATCNKTMQPLLLFNIFLWHNSNHMRRKTVWNYPGCEITWSAPYPCFIKLHQWTCLESCIALMHLTVECFSSACFMLRPWFLYVFFVFWFCSWSEYYIEKLLVSSEIFDILIFRHCSFTYSKSLRFDNLQLCLSDSKLSVEMLRTDDVKWMKCLLYYTLASNESDVLRYIRWQS